VRTQPDGGHPTIKIQTITRVEADSADVVYQVRGGTAWSPPEHFGGPPVTQPQRASGDPRAIPYYFELLPGNYRVDFLYVPVKDPLGWTHRLREEQTAWLECRPGLVYRLEGKLLQGGAGWVLAVDEEPVGEAGD
jgi:hypothetical protein